MNGIVADLILVVLLLLFCIIGYFKGFLRGLLSLCGFVGSAVVAYFTRDFFAGIIDKFFGWGTSIANFVMKQVANINASFVSEKFSDSTSMLELINASDINVVYKKIFEKFIVGADFSGEALSVGDVVSFAVSNLLLKVIAVVLIFIVLRIVVMLLNLLLKGIPKRSLVGRVDKTLGVFVGLAKGVIAIGLVLVIINAVCMIPSVSEKVLPIVDSSYITKHLLEFVNNSFLKL